ncbi:MAG: thioredoxin [Clostridia bacterium]
MSVVINLTKDNFKDEVLSSDKPVLIDFWAPWCAPCRAVGPIVDEIAKEVQHAKVAKVNIDEQPSLAQSFGIMSIPTLLVVKEGKITKKVVGLRRKAEILAMIS